MDCPKSQQYLGFKKVHWKQCNRPWHTMISQTNGQRRFFIEKQAMEEPQISIYSCYGLSNTTTVPLF
ncbi:MAG: hypothetical protein BWK74_01825 [Desulfobacteraceae bacterium A6]|nr:MAG: hypothetical protein BWK74_01825 [Desulfobacteraceae bacterium A6]